ncbi:DUF4190 domain-containing protein [Granulicoccus phenolivorans]|uniref:DUF4190 domain-containing protein n=1 Tax=Granulicoccus phenolivorans TaxID=266854 RepID=UPI000409450D|nr:DUF4190 domain-containing protein [Granulicoccus phenolivorans]
MSQNYPSDGPNRFSTNADGVTPAGADAWPSPAGDPWGTPPAEPAAPNPAPTEPADPTPTASYFPSYDANANYSAGYYSEQSAPPPMSYQPVVYQPAPTRANSPLAITAVVMSIATVFCGITAPFALGFGIAGYRQVNEHPDRYTGRGMAIAGMAVGGALTALWALFLLMAIIR